MAYGRPNRRPRAAPPPVLNPLQRHDLRRMLPLVPNDRRLLVVAAYLGIYIGELYDQCGLTARIRQYYGADLPPAAAAEAWRDVAMAWCWRISRRLDISITELWEIDDEFDPAAAVPAKLLGPRAKPGPRSRRAQLHVVGR
jgi:hypothetical protein